MRRGFFVGAIKAERQGNSLPLCFACHNLRFLRTRRLRGGHQFN